MKQTVSAWAVVVPFCVAFGSTVIGAAPTGTGSPEHAGRPVSLTEADRISYKAGPSPLDSPAQEITLKEGSLDLPPAPQAFPLSGEWQLIVGETDKPFTPDAWAKAMKAPVPGSVHRLWTTIETPAVQPGKKALSATPDKGENRNSDPKP